MAAGLSTPRGSALSLGFDLGSRALKYALVSDGGRPEIELAGAADLAPGIVEGGRVVDPTGFARTIAKRIDVRACRNAGVTFSIPSSLATLRWVVLPDLEPGELREAASFKVKRHLPYPVEQAYLDVSRPSDPDDPTAPSLVVAVKKDVVDSRAEAIARAGLSPLRAELEAQAILRVVERRLNERSVLWRDASLTIIDVGGTNTHMYVVQNQRLQFMRGVAFGADMFGAAIAQALNIASVEAFELLGHPQTTLTGNGIMTCTDSSGDRQIDLSRELEKLTREFLRLLRYFRSLHPERSYAGILDHMVVCGGIAGLSGLDVFLSRNLGLRVERARPIAGMAARFDLEAFESVSGRQEAFTVAIGLALSGLQKWTSRRENDANHEFVWTRGT